MLNLKQQFGEKPVLESGFAIKTANLHGFRSYIGLRGNSKASAMGYTNYYLKRHPAWWQMEGPYPPDDFVSNGATLAPDILFGIDLRPAAHFHDYAYSGKTGGVHCERERYWADVDFRTNLERCGLWWPIAAMYFYRVRLWGHLAYKYDESEEPKRTLGFWLNLLIGRYITW